MKQHSPLSSGAQRCLNRLRWYERRYNSVHPTQKKLAQGLKIAERTLRVHLAELRATGLIQVQQGGDGRAATYTITAGLTAGLMPGCFLVDDSQPQNNERVEEQNCRAETPQLCSILEYKNNPSSVVKTTPGRTDPFPEEFRQRVFEASGMVAIPPDLVEKLAFRAHKHGADATKSAALFLELYEKCHRIRGIQDGMAYLLGGFERELSAAKRPPERDVGIKSLARAVFA